MIKAGNIFKSPQGKITLFLILLGFIVVTVFMVFDHRDSIKSGIVEATNLPLEISYEAPLSEVRPDYRYINKKIEQEPEEEQQKDNSFQFPQGKKVKPSKRKVNLREYKKSSKTYKRRPRTRKVYQKMVKPYIPPIGLYTANPNSVPVDPSTIDAPYGQLLRCELAKTIETSNLKTPIIAMVTSPLWWNGREIIPAGVLVHGTAASSGMRDRVGTGTKWVLVWPHRNDMNGKELIVDALALACDRTEKAWGDIDGSAGIKGEVISDAEKKKMLAGILKFLAGFGENLIEQSEEYEGDTTTKTTGGKLKDALGGALAEGANEFARQIIKELSQNGSYVKAQAGTEFYLYIKQDLIIDQASKGKLVSSSSSRTKRVRTVRKSSVPTHVRRATQYD